MAGQPPAGPPFCCARDGLPFCGTMYAYGHMLWTQAVEPMRRVCLLFLEGVEVTVKGLLGGHSGINIHEDRGRSGSLQKCLPMHSDRDLPA
jgi:hypothetical protein